MTDGPDDGATPREAAPDELAVLLHDLRTPLSAMRTAVEIVCTDPTTPRQADALKTLEMAIDSLLAITRAALPSDDLPARAETRDTARDTIEAVADLFEPHARSRGLSLSRDISDELASYGLTDPLGLRRVLSVLFDNALKYTGEGGLRLSAGVRRGGPHPELSLTLADTGIGIETDERQRLFRPGGRGRRAEGRAGGSGLGLWSAARLAAAEGGRLELVATSPMGSTFGLRLPLLAPAPAPGSAAATSEQAARAVVADEAAPDSRRRRLLVVDDNAANRRMMQAMLEAVGFDVTLAESGKEALERLADAVPDGMLLDLTMPGMDGVETLARIRAQAETRTLPVVGITAAMAPNRADLARAGFSSVLTRPVPPAHLLNAIDRALTGPRDRQD
jgi:CheY-like chemotaxis protein